VTVSVVAIFGIVYLGMILGGLPFLSLNRTGIALLGAIALLTMGDLTLDQAAEAIHLPTIILLFAFMVVSAQLRLGGFYAWVTARVAALRVSVPLLLGALIFTVAGLSAVFSNDIVCLAAAPVLIDVCRNRGLHPLPFLLALACAANIGSAATLIGNPQNMLIGEKLQVSFSGYLADAAVPVLLGLLLTWAFIAWRAHATSRPAGTATAAAGTAERRSQDTQFDRWQTAKGLTVAAAIFFCFLFAPWPREVVALTGAGVLMLSRKLHSRHMLGLVDYELLVLFMGLFVVNHAFEATGIPAAFVADLAGNGLDLHRPEVLFPATFVLSNVVSNVPAVMLLLPVATHALAGLLLALGSTLAGNLFIVGSIANIIVVDAAERRGIHIDWKRHAAVGVPVTLLTSGVAALYLWLRVRTLGGA
jgi:Na+/H+ antiporter NhaD/arsenite permease-like protein